MTDTSEQRLPYRLRERFLSSTERALLRALTDLMGERYVICPKVGLNEIFYIVRPNENVHFFNKFFRKHVDFLLCDPKTLQPAFGVEMVRAAAQGEPRESDSFMEALFMDAGLPLVHVPAADVYAASELVMLFQLAVTKSGAGAPARAASPQDNVPNCPICGKMMVLRIHRSGANSGQQYYGCMDSPKCAGVVSIR